ncbi:hypothetical protein [Borrelia crocidurae]|uniref:Uncharacterized protein n=1 Tax=Borrelia crocidurae (strain Achema) TaxID=1155096 RepID=I0FCQ5_BORCA|nr:hypothetical protein [Borrelia crocidurae]AFI31261.1 hypothetical protein Q7M_482 [Borrelia crocidurae str. Achema]
MSQFKLKYKLLKNSIILIIFINISCIKNNDVKSKETGREITYIVNIKKNTEKIEIIRFNTNKKNKLIITLKNNKKIDIKQNSLAIFKKGNKTGHIIQEGIKAGEEKTFNLNINVNKQQKNIFYIFLKED